MAGKKSVKGNSGNGALAAAWTLALIALAFAIILASPLLGPKNDFFEPMVPRQIFAVQAQPGIEEFFVMKLVLALMNAVLAIYLLFTYVKDYIRLRAGFTLGIIAFLFSFLLYALSSLPIVPMLLGPGGGLRGVFSFVPMLFSAIGLLIFAWVSSE